jgi:2-dehydropantoate 2-reductase
VKVLVVGAGAIGSYVGGKLADQHAVTLLGRRPLVEAVRARGLEIVEPGTTHTARHVAVVDSIEQACRTCPHFDLALFCVKTYDTDAAIDLMRPYADRIDRFLSLQNGVSSEELLAQAFGCERIIAGTVLNPISTAAPGVIRLEKRQGGIGLAPLGANKLEPVVTTFKAAGLPARTYADYRALKWSKLLLNLLGNATSAILDMNTLAAFADRRVFTIEVMALREAVAVMRARHIRPIALPGYPVPLLVLAVRYLPIAWLQPIMRPLAKSGRGDKLPSLLVDLSQGKSKSEIDELNGVVARAGRAVGVPTPVNATLTRLVRDLVGGRVDRSTWRRQIDRLASEVALK